jgi:Ca2+-binding EF-hand superfamily protein
LFFQVVQQLFEKLDVDHDGHISFDEFLLLLRSGGSWVQPNVREIHTGDKTNRGSLGIDFQQCSGNTKERQTLRSSDQDSQFLALDTNSAGLAAFIHL